MIPILLVIAVMLGVIWTIIALFAEHFEAKIIMSALGFLTWLMCAYMVLGVEIPYTDAGSVSLYTYEGGHPFGLYFVAIAFINLVYLFLSVFITYQDRLRRKEIE